MTLTNQTPPSAKTGRSGSGRCAVSIQNLPYCYINESSCVATKAAPKCSLIKCTVLYFGTKTHTCKNEIEMPCKMEFSISNHGQPWCADNVWYRSVDHLSDVCLAFLPRARTASLSVDFTHYSEAVSLSESLRVWEKPNVVHTDTKKKSLCICILIFQRLMLFLSLFLFSSLLIMEDDITLGPLFLCTGKLTNRQWAQDTTIWITKHIFGSETAVWDKGV